MKKNIKLALATVITTLLVNTCMAADEFKVKLNGEYMNFDVPPVMIEDRILVPMRAIFEALGAEVSWDDATQTATGVTNDAKVSVTINEKAIDKNGEKTELDVPAQLVSERTMVPIRAVSEAFSCTVDWDDAESTVIISANTEEKEDTEIPEASKAETDESNVETSEKSVLSEFDIQENNDYYKIYKKDGTIIVAGSFKEISEMNGLLVTTSESDYKTFYTKEGKNVASGDKITDVGRGLICVEATRVANGMLRAKYVNSLGEVFSTIHKNENSTLVRLAYGQEYYYNGKKYTTPDVKNVKSNDNDYVLLDMSGNMISEPVFQRVMYYNGLYTVTENINIRSTGVISETGEVILPRIYEGATVCDNIILAKDENSKIFIFNYNGVKISDEWFNEVGNFHDGLAFVKKEVDNKTNQFGFINENGEIVIPLIYEAAESFKDGKARVKLDGKFVNIDIEGNIVE